MTTYPCKDLQTHICEIEVINEPNGTSLTFYRIVQTVADRSAVRCMNIQAKKHPERKYAAIPFALYNARRDDFDPMVTTYNMLSKDRKPVLIRASQKGGCCDPATERYHSM